MRGQNDIKKKGFAGVVVQLLSRVQPSVAPWTAVCRAPLSKTISWRSLKCMSIESLMLSNHLILCPTLLLLPSIFPSIRLFSSELALGIRWWKYWKFSISPSNEYSRLISFRTDWLDLLAVQGTLKGLLQHHNSKASISQCSAFLMVQLPHPYMTTGENTVLTLWTFVSKEIFLLFNMLPKVFPPRSRHLLISRLQSPPVMILEPMKRKKCHCFHFFPFYLHEVKGQMPGS